MKQKAGWILGTTAAYLYAIMPRIHSRAEKMKGIFYAHRGLYNKKKGIPENTMSAFAQAVDAGFGIELDIQLTKDGQVVVFHDFSLKRVCGRPGDVSDYTYRELSKFSICGTEERIPLFSDVLKLVDGRVPLLVELKYKNFSSRICEKADALLQNYGGEYSIESFHPLALLWYRIHRPEICRGQLSMNYQRQEGHFGPERILSRHLLYNFLSRPDFIAYDIRDRKAVSKSLCRSLFHCPCAAWTVRTPEQLQQCRKDYDCFIFEGERTPAYVPQN